MLGYTANNMLGRRMEDEDLAKFPVENRLDAINNATLRLANLLDNDHLDELMSKDDLIPATDGLSPATGSIALSGLSPSLIRNGVRKIYDNTTGALGFLHLVDYMDLDKIANGYLTPGANYKIAWIFGSTLYVRPLTVTVTVWYLGEPTALVVADLASSPGTKVLNLNPVLHPIIVDMAEAELWKQDGKSEKATSILTMADKEIQVLNERAVAERKELIGRKSLK